MIKFVLISISLIYLINPLTFNKKDTKEIKETRINTRVECIFERNSCKLTQAGIGTLDTLVALIKVNEENIKGYKISLTPLNCKKEISKNEFLGVIRCKVIADYLVNTKGLKRSILYIQEPDIPFKSDCIAGKVWVEIILSSSY